MPFDKDPTQKQPKLISSLSLTLEDHQKVGSTVQGDLEVLRQNPGKTYAETMSDEELSTHMRTAIAVLDAEYATFGNLDTAPSERINAIKIIEHMVPRLREDIRYLRSIGRLPEFADFNPKKRYALE